MKPKDRRLQISRREFLEYEFMEYEKMADRAQESGSFSAAVAAKRHAVELRAELDQLTETERPAPPVRSLESQKQEVLAEVARLRRGATEAGSFVAAANLLKLEREMIGLAESENSESDRRRRMDLDEAGMLSELLGVITRLPTDMQAQLRAALESDIGVN